MTIKKARHIELLFAMALLLSTATSALAAPMILACQASSGGAPYVITLDLDNKTITGDNTFAWAPREAVPIQVTDDTITWTVPADSNNTLSRVTGSLLSVGIGNSTGGRWESQCHIGKREF